MRPWLFVLVLVGGCGTQQARPVIANHQRSTPLVCSNDVVERLTHTLRERWDVPALLLRCTAGQFRSAGYFIEASVNGARRSGIVDPSGAELVPFVDEPSGDAYSFIASYRAVDLDRDGEDEIIESWRRSPSHGLHPDNWLVIRTVSRGRLIRIKGPYLSRYHPELGSCSGTWQLRRGEARSDARGVWIDIAIKVGPGIPPSDCLPAGKHRFELRGNSLVDATLRRR